MSVGITAYIDDSTQTILDVKYWFLLQPFSEFVRDH